MKRASAFLIRIHFIANAKYTLRLVADKGDLHGRKGGVWALTFLLHRSFTGWRGPLLMRLLLRSKCHCEVDSTDLAADDILHIEIRREVAEDPL